MAGIRIWVGLSCSKVAGISSGIVVVLAAASCSAISLQRQSVSWLQSPQLIGENELPELIWAVTGPCRLTRPSKDEGSEWKSRSSLDGESRCMVGKSFVEPSLDSGDEPIGEGDVYGTVKRVVGAESFIRFEE